MLILGIIGFGLLVGSAAQLVVVRNRRRGVDWGVAIVAGLAGSFVGGLLVSLLAGDGLELRPSGLVGSFAGALLVTGVWQWITNRQPTT